MHATGETARKKAELASYQLKDVAQVWYTQWKGKQTVKSDPIEWEEFKKTFFEKYIAR